MPVDTPVLGLVTGFVIPLTGGGVLGTPLLFFLYSTAAKIQMPTTATTDPINATSILLIGLDLITSVKMESAPEIDIPLYFMAVSVLARPDEEGQKEIKEMEERFKKEEGASLEHKIEVFEDDINKMNEGLKSVLDEIGLDEKNFWPDVDAWVPVCLGTSYK